MTIASRGRKVMTSCTHTYTHAYMIGMHNENDNNNNDNSYHHYWSDIMYTAMDKTTIRCDVRA